MTAGNLNPAEPSPSPPTRGCHSERGAARWPLWAVAIVLGLAALALLLPGLWVRFGTTPDSLAEQHLQLLADAVQMYDLDHHALPRSLEDLLQADARTGYPYLERIPQDPWKHPYAFRILDEDGKRFELRGAGPDGTPGTGDDLVYPPGEIGSGTAQAPPGPLDWTVVADLKLLRDQIASARHDRKPVVVEVWAEWCVYCKKYDRLLEGDEELKRGFGQLVRLKIDVSKGSADALLKEVEIPLLRQPYMVFISSSGRVIHQLDVGAYYQEHSKEELLRRVQQILAAK